MCEVICVASNIAMYRFAIVGAGDIPIAIPLCCLINRSPKCMWLLFMTRERALMSACGHRWG